MKRKLLEKAKNHKYFEDGTYIFHSSRFGGCAHGMIKSYRGEQYADPDPKLEKVFAEGHKAEAAIKKSLASAGARLTHDSEEIEHQLQSYILADLPGNYGKFGISCHPDGITNAHANFESASWKEAGYRILDNRFRRYEGSDKLMVFEHKNFGWTSYDKFINSGLQHFPNYSWQISIQAYAVQRYFNLDYVPAVLFSVERKHDFGSNRVCRIYDEPPHDLDDIRYRAYSIIDWAESGIMPDCDNTKYCEYHR